MESDGTQFLTSLGLWDICENCCTACTPLDPDDSSISANLQAWLKADAITGLSDGDPVGTWSDSSGNGNDATQSTSSFKPTYKTGIYSGSTLPTVRFDGTDDLLDWGTFMQSFGNSEWTAFVVVKQTGSGIQFAVSDYDAVGFSYDGFHLRSRQPGIETAKDYIDASTAHKDRVLSTSPTLGALHSYAAVVKNDASTRNKIFVGGLDVSNPTTGALFGAITSNASTKVARIGATHVIAGSEIFMQGDICELIVYDTVLTDAQIVGVQCYLNRWTT